MTILEAKGVSAEGAPSCPWGLFRVSWRSEVTADSDVGLLPSQRRVRRAAGSATCGSGSGAIDDGRPGLQAGRVDEPTAAVFMKASGWRGTMVPGRPDAGQPEPTVASDRWRRRGITPERVPVASKNGETHRDGPSLLFSIAARWAISGRGAPGPNGGVNDATGDPSPRAPRTVADRCRARTARRPGRRAVGTVSTVRMELHAHQGADSLAVLGSP